LSGRTHQVHTAVALRDGSGIASRLSVSDVTFRELGTEEMRRYWRSGEPADKAGAYAVQGLAAIFIRHIAGSYSGIMGLPLYETAELLAAVKAPATTGPVAAMVARGGAHG
jgi:septum formation protein